MTPSRFRSSTRSLRQATSLPRRNAVLSHRSLDLLLLAGTACLLAFLSQPIAAALVP